jgi:hypothetical protein
MSTLKQIQRHLCGRAKCGCWYSAEDGVPCHHDLQLATKEELRELEEAEEAAEYPIGYMQGRGAA